MERDRDRNDNDQQQRNTGSKGQGRSPAAVTEVAAADSRSGGQGGQVVSRATAAATTRTRARRSNDTSIHGSRRTAATRVRVPLRHSHSIHLSLHRRPGQGACDADPYPSHPRHAGAGTPLEPQPELGGAAGTGPDRPVRAALPTGIRAGPRTAPTRRFATRWSGLGYIAQWRSCRRSRTARRNSTLAAIVSGTAERDESSRDVHVYPPRALRRPGLAAPQRRDRRGLHRDAQPSMRSRPSGRRSAASTSCARSRWR
jgi:hypothetical protein